MRRSGTRLAAISLVVLLTLVSYVPALRGGFVWDDDRYVTENPSLRTAEGLRLLWAEPTITPQYYPLVFTVFWLQYHAWGLNPFGYHLVNVLLHAASALLVFALLTRLRVKAAPFAALLFAVHPVHVESVAWITELKNVLSGFLYLSSLGCYLVFARLEETSPPGNPRSRWFFYGVSLVLFLGALLSKTVTGTLPAVILLLIWWKRGRLSLPAVASTIPYFLLAGLLGAVTLWMEAHHVGASGPEWDLSLLERLLIAGRAIWFYAGKLVWPAPLIFIYPRWEIDAGSVSQYLYPLGVLAALAFLWRSRIRFGRGPLVASLFFVGTLFPALGFFDVYPMRFSFVADHFQYLASLGPLVLLAVGLATLLDRRKVLRTEPRYAVYGVLVLVLCTLTWRQAGIYRDKFTLFDDTITKNPVCWMAWNNRGVEFLDRGEPERALADFNQAIALKADYDEAYYNRGLVYTMGQDHARALEEYDRALSLRPDYADAYSNRGAIHFLQEDYDLALADWARVLELEPWSGMIHYNRALAYEAREDYAQALREAKRARELGQEVRDSYLERLEELQSASQDGGGEAGVR